MNEFIPNSFQVPNVLVDIYMPILSPIEFKCLLLVIRKTRGWHKQVDAISIAQFKEFTGVQRDKTLQSAIRSLEDRGLLKVIREPGRINFYTLSALFNKGDIVDKPVNKAVALSATSGTKGIKAVALGATTTSGAKCHPTKDHINTNKTVGGFSKGPRDFQVIEAWAIENGLGKKSGGESFNSYINRVDRAYQQRLKNNGM